MLYIGNENGFCGVRILCIVLYWLNGKTDIEGDFTLDIQPRTELRGNGGVDAVLYI